MMNIDAICDQLEEMTMSLQTALQTGDISSISMIVQGRIPLVDRCITLSQGMEIEDQKSILERLKTILVMDDMIISAIQSWLIETRNRLIHAQKGTIALESYCAPLKTLHH
jgi:hypothetical protein